MSAAPAFSESRFWKHVGVILIVKAIIICSLWFLCFGPGHRVMPDATQMEYKILEGSPHA